MSLPICDRCVVEHRVIGVAIPIVRCSKSGERWAPMVDADCSDLRIHGVGALAKITGLPESEIDPILVKVRSNKALLDACSRHEFEPASDKFGAKHRCKKCGGEVDVLHSIWYRKGLDHAASQHEPFELPIGGRLVALKIHLDVLQLAGVNDPTGLRLVAVDRNARTNEVIFRVCDSLGGRS